MKAPAFRAALAAVLLLAACGTVDDGMSAVGLAPSAPPGAPAPGDDWSAGNFAVWSPQTPDYLLYPGDEIEIAVPSAPELTRTVLIGPDGRFSFPYAGAVQAGNRTTPEVEQSLSAALARELRRPYVEITLMNPGSQKVLVLGEVQQPGIFDLSAPMGALEAVAMAGGFTTLANTAGVSIIRRAPDGRAMRRTVNLRATLRGAAGGDYDVLARYDIVYVPRSGIAGAGVFMQQVRNLLPFNFGFSYALNNDYDWRGSASTP